MSDIIPNGITETKESKLEKYLKSIDSFSEQILELSQKVLDDYDSNKLQQTTTDIKTAIEKYDNFQKTIERQLNILSESGASKQDIKNYLMSVSESVKQQKEIANDVISSSLNSINRTFKDLQIEDVETAKQLTDLLSQIQISDEQENEKTRRVLSQLGDKIKSIPGVEDLANSLIGPLRLITEPIGDFFGVRGPLDIFEKIGGFFTGRKEKITPKRNEMLKRGIEGASAVYLADTLIKGLGGEQEGSDVVGGLFKKFFGDMSGTAAGGAIGPMLMKALPFATLAAGLIWGVIDGIIGFFKSEDWGVSKISGAIGSFLGGAGEGGLLDVFKGMGKWALIGAGIGSFVPVLGTLAGGLIGAALGGILGFFGGEKIAKGLDAVGNWFLKGFSAIGNWFSDIFTKTPKILKDVGKNIIPTISDIGKNLFSSIGNLGTKALSSVTGFLTNIPGNIISSIGNIKTFITDNIFPGIVGIFSNIFNGISSFIKDPLNTIKGLFDNFINSITGFFSDIFGFFDFIGNVGISGIIKNIGDLGGAQERYSAQKAKEEEILVNLKNDPNYDKRFNELKSEKGLFGGSKYSDKEIDKILANELLGIDLDSALKEAVNVSDAIIKKSGQIIHTSPEDNIIATKNDIEYIPSTDKEILKGQRIINDTNDNLNTNLFSDERIVSALERLIDILQQKEFANIIENNVGTKFDLESLRFS